MPSSVSPPRVRARSFSWRVAIVLAIVLVLLSLIFIRLRLHFDTGAKLAAVRSAGLPASGAELNQWLRSLAPADNGALILTQAFALFRSVEGINLESSSLPRFTSTNTWPPEVRARLRDFLETNAPALNMLDAGLKFSRFRYPVDYSPGLATLLPHLRQVKIAGVLLSLRTALAAEESPPNQPNHSNPSNHWSQLLEQQIKLAETLNDEPTVIGTLVRLACLQIAVNTAERSFQFSAPDPAACRRLQSAFTRASDANLLQQAFISERAMAAPVFRMSLRQMQKFGDIGAEDDEEARKPPVSDDGNLFMAATGFFERDLNFYLGVMQTAINLAQQPAPASLVLTNHFETAGVRAKSRFYFLSSMLLPSLGRVAVKHADSQARLRLAATAFAIEAYRQTHGRLPPDLKELTPDFLPAVPIDPFTASPIHYTPLQPGYRLYSVGSDGANNGGRPIPKNRRGPIPADCDLTFTVSR